MGYDLNRFHGEVDEELKCPMCSGVLQEPLQAPLCEHAFCRACIRKWLWRQPTSGQITCPVDRSTFNITNLRTVPRILRNLLSSHLVGEASKLIQHLQVSDNNYQIAWDILQARYNNQRLLVSAWLNKLLAQTAIHSESSEAIKRLHDTTNECLLALKNINIDTTSWDTILLHILISKLDKETHRLYEQSLEAPKECQTLENFMEFLENRFQMMEAYNGAHHKRGNKTPIKTSGVAVKQNEACAYCKIAGHAIYKCQSFLKMTPSNRLKSLRERHLCVNCLKSGHVLANCSSRSCFKCPHKHNTLLHIERSENRQQSTGHQSTSNNTASSQAIESTVVTSLAANSKQQHSSETYTFLGTALINVSNHEGRTVQIRAILDSGSQLNFISKNLSKYLNLTSKKEETYICGIGNTTSSTQNRANVKIATRHNKYITNIEVYILPQITAKQPSRFIDTQAWPLPTDIEMADPQFNKPQNVDMLIGAELFCELILGKQQKLNNDLPVLQATKFGWVVFGRVNIKSDNYFCGINTKIENHLQRFWELERYESISPNMSPRELSCERHFLSTVCRDSTGKFIVELPFLHSAEKLGLSYEIAQRRFYRLEKKLAANPELKGDYVNFMKKYLALGHMELIPNQTLPSIHYFLPHHCVLRPSSTTTKLRVVFDGSCKTYSNISLNDILHVGPTVQEDLFSIILRFRLPRFVFTSDISKMYRQIWVNERHQNLQLILWRENSSDDLNVYKLRTVTYGTRPAPFLATRCLKKLAEDEQSQLPLGSKVVLNNFYVDDVMAGSNNLEEAIQMVNEVQELLQKGGFQLRKWCANNRKLLDNIPPEHCEATLDFNEKSSETINTLGLSWHPAEDYFTLKTHLDEKLPHTITKRNKLTDVARVYDPLGIVSPVITSAKILIQKLWILELDWDTEIPPELQMKWLHYRTQLRLLEKIRIPRHILINNDPYNIQLHAFSDASQKAYGACLYIRSCDRLGNITVRLLCSRSRVAPVKTITLPRLELCAATLMANLVDKIKKTLQLEFKKTYYWTDSTIILSWIKAPSTSQETFVANKISSIQQCSETENWHHIGTKENPADLISRGVFPDQLLRSEIWFNGPQFLRKTEGYWPISHHIPVTNNTHKTVGFVTTPEVSKSTVDQIKHNNSFLRLQEIVAFMFRFCENCKNPMSRKLTDKPDAVEMERSMNCIVKSLQASDFKDDYQQLIKNKSVLSYSKLSCLTPFVQNGIIKVGGRLQASILNESAKHPIVLNGANPIVQLLMSHLHNTHLHAGPSALLAITRQRFWPLNGKTLAQKIVKKCLRCAKVKPLQIQQIMGSLPPERVIPTRPFTNVGIDFCGPFHIHYNLRGKRPTKAYLAVFVGFAVNAIHLEIVTDLTTAAFVGALKRFIGRRGCPLKIFCDNATNFMGAKREMQELHNLLQTNETKNAVVATCSNHGIQWCPIPPRSPHFGGLWEAAVKSAKYHLHRILMSAHLTYEELHTVVVEVEAVLNSRPLTPMSSDSNDLEVLTPGHFLIGQPLTAMFETTHQPANITLLKRWELVKFLRKEFWRRWSAEYLQELQNRYKWKNEYPNIKNGSLVLLKEDNIPPLQWRMARVIQTIQGADNLVRVVQLKTSSGITQRAIQKVCPLPIETGYPPIPKQPQPSNILSKNITTNATDKKGLNATQTDSIPLLQPPKRKLDQDKLKTTSNRTVKTSSIFLHTLLLISLVLPSPAMCSLPTDEIEVTKFKNQPGIYFEELGPVNLINNDWKIFVYINMTMYWKEFFELESYKTKLDEICNSLTTQICKEINKQIDYQITNIQNANELISKQHGLINRRKRSPFDFIGSVASSLFGVLDQNDAKTIEMHIQESRQNERHLLNLIKNQTSIIESTFNIIKQTEARTNARFKTIDTQMKKLYEEIANSTQKINEMQLFTSLTTLTTLIITNYQKMQETMLDILTDFHHDKMNPLILNPNQLMEEIKNIQQHLPSNVMITSQTTEDIIHYTVQTNECQGKSNEI